MAKSLLTEAIKRREILTERRCLHEQRFRRQLRMSNDTMWSDQSSEQVSTPNPMIETALMGSADDHVIVKLLTANNTASSNGSEVLTKLLTGNVQSSAPSTITVGTTILLSTVQSQGLRKIEPKPADSGIECEKVEADNESNASGR